MTFLEIGFIIRVEAEGGEGVSGLLWRRDFFGLGMFCGCQRRLGFASFVWGGESLVLGAGMIGNAVAGVWCTVLWFLKS